MEDAAPAGFTFGASFRFNPSAGRSRPAAVAALIENTGLDDVVVKARLVLPEDCGTRLGTRTAFTVPSANDMELVWEIEAAQAGSYDIALDLRAGDEPPVTASLTMGFLPPVEQRELDYIPEPVPVHSELLVGAHHCPLWEADKPEMWAQLLLHPERTPALGFYAGENPEVADWETTWAVEHGIDFFIYCW